MLIFGKNHPMVIGIGGISNSGKSALAIKLKVALQEKLVTIICQDDFVFPKDQIPRIKDHIDWESPESIDFENLCKAVLEASKSYDIIIVEGLMIFHDQLLLQYFNYSIFLKISHATFVLRKQKDLRWGQEPEWYINHIWESYLNYGLPQKNLNLIQIEADIGAPDINPILLTLFTPNP